MMRRRAVMNGWGQRVREVREDERRGELAFVRSGWTGFRPASLAAGWLVGWLAGLAGVEPR
jgi:uncharacterized protein YbdZ (MbtH family)